MTHDEFVGDVQHRAHLPSRGAAETVIRATLSTLGERLQPRAAARLAAQLPQELGLHLRNSRHFEHLSLPEFFARVAMREGADVAKSMFHVRAVTNTIREAVSPGLMRKIEKQMPEEFGRYLFH